MLLKNLDIQIGLVNGVQLLVEELYDNHILVKILIGPFKGNRAVIGREETLMKASRVRIEFNRIQIPVRLSYGITINKA